MYITVLIEKSDRRHMADIELQTSRMLLEHFAAYPKMQIEDMLKYLHQSSFGCEHMVTDLSVVTEYIRKEAEGCKAIDGPMVEALDGEYCRVHLSCIKEGLCPETLGKLFFLSAQHEESGTECLEQKLSVMENLIKEGRLPFEAKSQDIVSSWRDAGYPARHHSDAFRNTYFPAYRVVKKEFALFLPLFLRIDRMLQRGTLVLAIEGPCGSGKSTVANVLEQVYGCTVFHMDDFFLRPHQRTAERLSEPGGNVDRERFLEEVLLPVSRGEKVLYRPFDCSIMDLEEEISVLPGRFVVVEGAYSMHPDLREYFDLSVFLDIESELQRERIQKRNTPQMAERFFSTWIPMEQRYFEELSIKEKCDLVIAINE